VKSPRRPTGSAHVHARRDGVVVPSHEALQRASSLFRAVGDLARLRLLYILGSGERCVSDLSELGGTKMSTLSQQLRVLFAERIVLRRREGKHIYYRLADAHVEALVRAAIEHAEEH
jgi:DNA-binding transcriptional ArsR family regulator